MKYEFIMHLNVDFIFISGSVFIPQVPKIWSQEKKVTNHAFKWVTRSLEQSIAKYGYNNHLHHQNELLPSLIQQISSSKDSFGSYDIPSHAEERYLNTKIKPIV